ncbi:hypothetical protein Taro_030169 [Colocasia esculenta]|uniref:Secreted protein n=1 Tax=Colocasia esculenta TaxID=4460 RepID=A0A843VLS1_COLES|nr:hypothetical protein [Colocasia esculenta]
MILFVFLATFYLFRKCSSYCCPTKESHMPRTIACTNELLTVGVQFETRKEAFILESVFLKRLFLQAMLYSWITSLILGNVAVLNEHKIIESALGSDI